MLKFCLLIQIFNNKTRLFQRFFLVDSCKRVLNIDHHAKTRSKLSDVLFYREYIALRDITNKTGHSGCLVGLRISTFPFPFSGGVVTE